MIDYVSWSYRISDCEGFCRFLSKVLSIQIVAMLAILPIFSQLTSIKVGLLIVNINKFLAYSLSGCCLEFEVVFHFESINRNIGRLG